MTIQSSCHRTSTVALLFFMSCFAFNSARSSESSGYDTDDERSSRGYTSERENESSSSDTESSEDSDDSEVIRHALAGRSIKNAGHWPITNISPDVPQKKHYKDPSNTLLSESGNRRRSIEEETQDFTTPSSPVFERDVRDYLSQVEKEERLAAFYQRFELTSLSNDLRDFIQQCLDVVARAQFLIPQNSTFMTPGPINCLFERLASATGHSVVNDDYNRALLIGYIRPYIKDIHKDMPADVIDFIAKNVKDALIYKEEEPESFSITDLSFLFSKLDVAHAQDFLSSTQHESVVEDHLRLDVQKRLIEIQQRDELRRFFAPLKESFQQVNSPMTQILKQVGCCKSCPQITNLK